MCSIAWKAVKHHLGLWLSPFSFLSPLLAHKGSSLEIIMPIPVEQLKHCSERGYEWGWTLSQESWAEEVASNTQYVTRGNTNILCIAFEGIRVLSAMFWQSNMSKGALCSASSLEKAHCQHQGMNCSCCLQTWWRCTAHDSHELQCLGARTIVFFESTARGGTPCPPHNSSTSGHLPCGWLVCHEDTEAPLAQHHRARQHEELGSAHILLLCLDRQQISIAGGLLGMWSDGGTWVSVSLWQRGVQSSVFVKPAVLFWFSYSRNNAMLSLSGIKQKSPVLYSPSMQTLSLTYKS